MDFLPAFMDDALYDDGTLLGKFRVLMFKFWHYMQAAVISTRSYSDGLDLIAQLRHLLDHFQGDLSPPEYQRIDQMLIEFEFRVLDKMDAWYDYVELYRKHRSTPYTRQYAIRKRDKWTDGLIVEENAMGTVLHFYYATIEERYRVIRRKMERASRKGNTKGLLHHKKSDLSNEEVEARIERILYAAKIGAQVFY